MSKPIYVSANTGLTNSFRQWLDQHNSIVSDMGSVVVTVAPFAQPNTTNGAWTVGNNHIEGSSSAKNLIASDSLSGGTVSVPATLNVISNVVVNTSTVLITSVLDSAVGANTGSLVTLGGAKINKSLRVIGVGTFAANVAVGENLAVTSNTSTGTLNASGLSTLVATNINGALVANTTADIRGVLTANTTNITGPMTASNTAVFNGTVNTNSTLTANTTNINGVLTANTSATIRGALTANTGTFSGTLGVNGVLTANTTNINGVLTANTSATINGVLTANTGTFGGDVTVIGPFVAANTVTIAGTISVSGASTLVGAVTAMSTISASNTVSIKGTLTANSVNLSGPLIVSNTVTVSSNFTTNGPVLMQNSTFTLNSPTATIGANTTVNGRFTTSGIVTSTNVTDSTTPITGSNIISGGVGIAKNLNVGGTVGITGNTTISGSLTVLGTATFSSNAVLSVDSSTVQHLIVTDDYALTGAKLIGSIVPQTTDTSDIGTSLLSMKTIYANNFVGALSGVAASATVFQNARTINGISFNGSANITVDKIPAIASVVNAKYPLPFFSTTALTIANNTLQNFNYATTIAANPSISTIYADHFDITSDARLKENILPIETPLEKIMNIRGVEFVRKSTGKKEFGVIAQEIEKILPELVNSDGEFKTVNMLQIIGILIEAVKELSEKIDTK